MNVFKYSFLLLFIFCTELTIRAMEHNAHRSETEPMAQYVAMREYLVTHPNWQDFWTTDPDFLTLLHIAAIKGDLGGAQCLLDNGAGIEEADGFSLTPLHKAVVADRKPMVRLLLGQGACITAKGFLNKTPLSQAVDTQNVEVVSDLLRHAHFTPRNFSAKRESYGRIQTVLCTSKRMGWPITVRNKILCYLGEDLLNREHYRLLLNSGIDLKSIVALCPFVWHQQIYKDTDHECKARFLEKLVPAIVEHRLCKLKELLESYPNSGSNGNDEIIAMLDKNTVEQHCSAMSQNVQDAIRGINRI